MSSSVTDFSPNFLIPLLFTYFSHFLSFCQLKTLFPRLSRGYTGRICLLYINIDVSQPAYLDNFFHFFSKKLRFYRNYIKNQPDRSHTNDKLLIQAFVPLPILIRKSEILKCFFLRSYHGLNDKWI